jgi:hypothetical protein
MGLDIPVAVCIAGIAPTEKHPKTLGKPQKTKKSEKSVDGLESGF